MSAQPINEEVALRIGLAVRALPDTDARQLIPVLIAMVGQPITASKLSKLRLNRFKQEASSILENATEDDVKSALSYLKGRGIKWESEPLPEVEAYKEGDMPGSIRIACSSDNGDKIDGHFGSCQRFLIYQVTADNKRLVEIRTVPKIDPDDDKNAKRAELISDCHVLATKSIGGPAAAKVVRAGLHPMKLGQVKSTDEFIAQMQGVLQNSPPPWLAKVMGDKPEERIRFEYEGETVNRQEASL